MLDWLPHNERGQNSHPVLGSRERSVPLLLARVAEDSWPLPLEPLSYSLVVRPFLESIIASQDHTLCRAWYGYMYVSPNVVDLPPSIVTPYQTAKLRILTTQQLLDRARLLANQTVIERSSFTTAILGLANFEFGEALAECRRALDEIALRMCEGGVLDTIDSLYMLNNDELDDYINDPQIFIEALRARGGLWHDVADREPPEILDARTLPFGLWPRRGGIRVV